jgi:cytochrome o ubiquinol oxidase subunit 3
MEHAEHNDTPVFGFWVYLMTDCVLFATLFATYAVLRNNNFGGPTAHELFHNLRPILAETIILLTSSFTCGLALLALQRRNKNQVIGWFLVTLLLGISFLYLEISEFTKLIGEGSGPDRSGFLSSFFTLVGTHGTHIFVGSVAMIIFMSQVWKRGLTPTLSRRLLCLGLFWHFLDIVWIFIFSIVYLMGALS